MEILNLDKFSDFVMDALNGHHPEAVSDFQYDGMYFTGDFYLSTEKPNYVKGVPNSIPMIKHELLENYGFVECNIKGDKFYELSDYKHAIPFKNGKYWLVIEGDYIHPLSLTEI